MASGYSLPPPPLEIHGVNTSENGGSSTEPRVATVS